MKLWLTALDPAVNCQKTSNNSWSSHSNFEKVLYHPCFCVLATQKNLSYISCRNKLTKCLMPYAAHTQSRTMDFMILMTGEDHSTGVFLL